MIDRFTILCRQNLVTPIGLCYKIKGFLNVGYLNFCKIAKGIKTLYFIP